MKFIEVALLIGGISSFAFASDNSVPIGGVTVANTDNETLSIQNMSASEVVIDIFGEEFVISPMSGVHFECASHTYLEVQVKNIIHDYFEVQCNSRIVFNEDFNALEVTQ